MMRPDFLNLSYLAGFMLFMNVVFSSDYASYSGGFLRMGITARSIAMGSGFTAELDQGFTAYHNPAGISFVTNRQASVTNHSLQLDRNFYVASFETNLPPTAGIGFAWIRAGVNQIDGRTEEGEHTGFYQQVRMLTSSVLDSSYDRGFPWELILNFCDSNFP